MSRCRKKLEEANAALAEIIKDLRRHVVDLERQLGISHPEPNAAHAMVRGMLSMILAGDDEQDVFREWGYIRDQEYWDGKPG